MVVNIPELIIDDTDAFEGIPPEACTYCKHILSIGSRKCKAFKDKIPDKIWSGENDHKKPYPGDHGIQFEK